MNEILGYDCNGNEIYEFMILGGIWTNDIDISELEDTDPRQYCAVVAEDGKAYAISVFDHWNKELIRERENIPDDEEIPTIIKPISEMEGYEITVWCGAYGLEARYYDLCTDELKNKLNKMLGKSRELRKR